MTIFQLKNQLNLWQPTVLQSNPELSQELSINWMLPSSLTHGILTTNIAFQLAKTLRQNPNIIAQNLLVDLQSFVSSNNLNLKCSAIGAYLNVAFEDDFWSQYVATDIDYSKLVETSNSKFALDYIGANVAKRLHAGHMRVCNIGDCIRRVMKLKYPNLITDNHWGDWGINMGILLWGWKNYDHNSFEVQMELIDRLSTIYVWSNAQKTVIENWDKAVRQEFLKLEKGDEENYNLWQQFILTTKTDLAQDLKMMNVPPLDIEQGESFYEQDMAILTEFMNTHNIWKSEGEARFFDFDEVANNWANISPQFAKRVSTFGRSYLISSTGYTSYCYRDVATKFQYARDLKVDRSLVITDKTQAHNFDQAFGVICYLASLPQFVDQFGEQVADRLKWQAMNHLGFGFLSLSSGKMSSRKGNVLLLRDLVAEVESQARITIGLKSPDISVDVVDYRAVKLALSAIKWNDLKQSYDQDIVLDIPTILNFEGNTGVYQLYTYARLNSVLTKLLSVCHAATCGCLP